MLVRSVTSERMRRSTWCAAAAALLVVAAASASASARDHAGARVDCGAKALTFLFWPQGHHAIPSIGFPEYLPPHMEVYKKAAGTYPDQNEVAVIEFTASGQVFGGFARSCKTVRRKIASSKPLKAKRTAATALQCRFRTTAQLDYKKSATGAISISMSVTLKTKLRKAPLEVLATMTGIGSTLRYDPKYCKAYPPPQ
jgi:hypothetical protein